MDHKRRSAYDSPDNDNLFLLLEVETILEEIAGAGRCHQRRRRILSPATTRNYRRTRTDFLGIWTMFYYRYVRFNVKGNCKIEKKKREEIKRFMLNIDYVNYLYEFNYF